MIYMEAPPQKVYSEYLLAETHIELEVQITSERGGGLVIWLLEHS